MKLAWRKSQIRQCVDCGYVSVQRDGDDPFVELNEKFRNSPSLTPGDPNLACTVQEFDLWSDELDAWRALDTPRSGYDPTFRRGEVVSNMLRLERRCSQWTKHVPGFAPKQQFTDERKARDARQTLVRSWVAICVAVLALGIAIWSHV